MSRRSLSIAWLLLLGLSVLACGDAPTEGELPTADAPTEGAPLSVVTQEGPVTATVELSPAEPRLGDSLTLTLRVEAEPDVTVEMPAFGEALGRFSIVDFTPRAQTEPDGRTVASQRYTLQAPMSGRQRIPPLRIEFLDEREGRSDPDREDEYRELLTDELSVEIASVLPEGTVTEELRPLRGALRERNPNALRLVTVLGALALLGGMAAVAWYFHRLSLERARITAYDKAMRRLAALEQRGFPTAGEEDGWYVELSDIVRRYLEDRYGVRAPELTTEEFLNEAKRSAELTPDHRELLTSFLAQCDQVKFAAYHPDQAESREALTTSRKFLEETRLLPGQAEQDEQDQQANKPAA